MTEDLLSVLATVVTISIFVVVFIYFHQHSKFIGEWTEDHAGSTRWETRLRLAPMAIFSSSLSERCRERRGRLLRTALVFVTLLLVLVGLIGMLRAIRGLP